MIYAAVTINDGKERYARCQPFQACPIMSVIAISVFRIGRRVAVPTNISSPCYFIAALCTPCTCNVMYICMCIHQHNSACLPSGYLSWMIKSAVSTTNMDYLDFNVKSLGGPGDYDRFKCLWLAVSWLLEKTSASLFLRVVQMWFGSPLQPTGIQRSTA